MYVQLRESNALFNCAVDDFGNLIQSSITQQEAACKSWRLVSALRRVIVSSAKFLSFTVLVWWPDDGSS